MDYLYRNKVKLNIFYDIDPYNDTLLKKEDILKLIEDCDIILLTKLIKTKECINSIEVMGNHPIIAFKDLRILCLKAIEKNKNIISIGDKKYIIRNNLN